MRVAGINNHAYYYRTKQQKGSRAGGGGFTEKSLAPSNCVLHMGSEESKDGKALGMLGFPDGSSSSVFKGEGYTTDNPIFKVKTWDAKGSMTETEIDASKVDPANASLQEMMALNAYRQLNGGESFGNELMMSAGRLHEDGTASGYDDFFSKGNWIAEWKDFMEMQYQLGNMPGYLRYKRAVMLLQNISDAVAGVDNEGKNIAGDKSAESSFTELMAQYGDRVKDRIENGEPAYQTGGQSYTEKEWKKLIERIDGDIEKIKEEQEDRIEKQKKKEEQKKELTEEQTQRLFAKSYSDENEPKG